MIPATGKNMPFSVEGVSASIARTVWNAVITAQGKPILGVLPVMTVKAGTGKALITGNMNAGGTESRMYMPRQ